jgi:hypothetical protein
MALVIADAADPDGSPLPQVIAVNLSYGNIKFASNASGD